MITIVPNRRYRELQRFVLVGIATFILNLSAFYFFFRLMQLDYRHAISYAYVITVVSHFAANKLFTFSARKQPVGHNAARYGVMLVLNYCITLAVSWLLIGRLGLPGYIAVLCYTLGNALMSFVLMKYVVFKPPHTSPTKASP